MNFSFRQERGGFRRFDVATTDGDGRLSQVLGFLDRVPVVSSPTA